MPIKTPLAIFFAALTLTLAASASPALLVETTITRHHADGSKEVLASPRIVVESGRKAVIQIDKLEYAVTPALLDDGTVEIRAVLSEHNGEKIDRLASPRTTARLGQSAGIQIDDLAFMTKTSLAKKEPIPNL